MIDHPLVNEGYEKAIETLKKNMTELGFSASTEKHVNYFSIWGRDHSICVLGAILSGDEDLIETAKKGILVLLKHQADSGQVPSYVEIENRKKVYGGLGSITSIDSNMWVIIAAAMLYKKTGDKRFISSNAMIKYTRIYRLLKAFDSNNCGLLEVHRAGDWADIFNRTYHVLYDEVLYYQTLKDLLYLFKEGEKKVSDPTILKKVRRRIRWITKKRPYVKRRINGSFWLTKDNVAQIYEDYLIYDPIPETFGDYYQSHMMPFKHEWTRRFDSFGNVLAIATKISDKKRSKKIIQHVLKHNINRPFPLTALSPPVFKHEKDWESIYYRKEMPYEYHNGGIWPVIAGFWIYVLNKNNKPGIARQDMIALAEKLKSDDWKFHEYFHGKEGTKMGRSEQAWSAAGYIIAYQSFNHNMVLFDN